MAAIIFNPDKVLTLILFCKEYDWPLKLVIYCSKHGDSPELTQILPKT